MEPDPASIEEPILEAFVDPIVQGNHTVEHGVEFRKILAKL